MRTLLCRTALSGVKRKGLASELLAQRSDSYHQSWTSLWDTEMPQDLLVKERTLNVLYLSLREVRTSSPDHDKPSNENICHVLSVQTSPLPALQQSGHLAGPGKNALRGKNSRQKCAYLTMFYCLVHFFGTFSI